MPITISPTSFDAINELHNRVPEFDTWQETDWSERIGKTDYHAVLATVDGQPAGYMVSYDRYQDGSVYCWMTAVLPQFRKKGVLAGMVADLVTWAEEKGYQSITVKTRNNRRAMLRYLVNSGFAVVAFDKREPLADSRILFTKPLADFHDSF